MKLWRYLCACKAKIGGAMEGYIFAFGWMVAGGTLGVVLMCLMFLAKESGERSEDREITEARSTAAD